jgi:activator of HSP90 ATPase
MIEGRNVELRAGERVVQAWRANNWPEGAYSIVSLTLKAEGKNTRVVLEHAGFPDVQGPHLDKGWHDNYWEPMRKFLA